MAGLDRRIEKRKISNLYLFIAQLSIAVAILKMVKIRRRSILCLAYEICNNLACHAWMAHMYHISTTWKPYTVYYEQPTYTISTDLNDFFFVRCCRCRVANLNVLSYEHEYNLSF